MMLNKLGLNKRAIVSITVNQEPPGHSWGRSSVMAELLGGRLNHRSTCLRVFEINQHKPHHQDVHQ